MKLLLTINCNHMKRKISKLSSIILLAFIGINASAQLSDVSQMMQGGMGDAEKLMTAYMNPMAKGFATSLSNGWYNTAKPHSLFGFDVTFTSSVNFLPKSEKTFDLSTLGLTTLKYDPLHSVAQTISGSGKNNSPVWIENTIGGKTIQKPMFNLPQGQGASFVPTVMIQAGLGLPFGSEIMFRFFPTVKIGKFADVGLWGIGAKHDIKQWIPVVSETPFWALSAMIGYTSFYSSVKGTFLTPTVDNFYLNDVDMSKFSGQGVEMTAKAFTLNLLASTDIPIINLYAGLGYNFASSNLKLTGYYPLPAPPTAQDVTTDGQNAKARVQLSAKDPISINFKSNSGLRASIGLRLKLGLFTLHYDITSSAGSTIHTAGMGFSFR